MKAKAAVDDDNRQIPYMRWDSAGKQTLGKYGKRADWFILNPEWIFYMFEKEERHEWMSKPDEWVEIAPGDYSPNDDPPPSYFSNQPVMYPQTGNTCLVSSFASALHLAGYQCLASFLIKNIDSLRQGADLVPNFVCLVNNTRTTNAKGEKMLLVGKTHFNIYNGEGQGPAVVILHGSNESVTHAVSVYGQYLIDASWKYAMPRNQDCLNWCCAPAQFLSPKKVFVLEPPSKKGRKRKRKRRASRPK